MVEASGTSGERGGGCRERVLSRAFLVRWFAEEWSSVLFVVSVVTVLHLSPQLGVLKPLAQFSLFVMSNLGASGFQARSSESETASDSIWLIGIPPEDFEDAKRYGERRPFSRCILAQDIEKVLAQHPKVLVVDLDLSPAPPAPVPQIRAHDEQCQKNLDDLLAAEVAEGETSLILLEPFPAIDAALDEKKRKWREKPEWQAEGPRGIKFGSGEIEYPLRLALEFTWIEQGLAELACKAAKVQHCLYHAGDDHPRPISYKAFQTNVRQLSAADLSTRPNDSFKDRVVFFGSRSGLSDYALTPIGESHGVLVHAAKYASLLEKSRYVHWFAFVTELCIAFAFSFLCAAFMTRYLEVALDPTALGRAKRGIWIVAFTVGFVLFLAALMSLALFTFMQWALVTEPLLIALGLTFDGFVLASWAHLGAPPEWTESRATMLSRVAARPASWAAEVAHVRQTGRFLAFSVVFRWLLFWLVLLWAVVTLFQ